MKKLKNQKTKKIFNNIIDFVKKFWLTVWYILKSMGNIKGMFSFLVTFLICSGTSFIVLGSMLSITWISTVGYSMLTFYFLPTFSVILNIMLAFIFQRYILRDKSISLDMIKEKWNKVKDSIKK